MKGSVRNGVLVCVFAFFGGFVSQQFFSSAASYAQPVAGAVRQDVNTNFLLLRDDAGRRRIDLDASGGRTIQDFYGTDGTLRLQLGTYPGDPATNPEATLPLITLSDKNGRLRMLLRVAAGNNQSPILVMKDTKGKDRVVLGLDLNGADEEPFLAYFDKYGGKHLVFGNF